MALYNGHNEDASGNILLSIGNGMAATVESGTTASQAYTKGAYLYYNNRLCKVIAAIASGNTLTVGTNIAYTSLGAELTSHLRASDGKEFYFDYQNGQYGYNTSASRGTSTFIPFDNTRDIAIYKCVIYFNDDPSKYITCIIFGHYDTVANICYVGIDSTFGQEIQVTDSLRTSTEVSYTMTVIGGFYHCVLYLTSGRMAGTNKLYLIGNLAYAVGEFTLSDWIQLV